MRLRRTEGEDLGLKMEVELRRSVVEYGRELLKGFYSLVGSLLVVLGLVGIFWADAEGLHILGVIGVAAGVLLAPFFAFHRVRLQRDAIVAQGSPFARVRFANALSTGNWGIDNFGGTQDDGFAARAIVAAEHDLKPGVELTSHLAAEVVARLGKSACDGYLQELVAQPGDWELMTPTNDWVITATRKPVSLGEGWEVYSRCIVQLPRSFGGRYSVVAVDVFFRPQRDEAVPDVQFNPALSPSPAGRARLDLPQARDLLAALATTAVSDIGEIVFPQIVELPRRRWLAIRRRHPQIRLAGPNLELRSRPRMLSDVLELPDLSRRSGAPETNLMMAETPDVVNARDSRVRDAVIVDALIRCLKQLEFTAPERYRADLERGAEVAVSEARVGSA